MKSGLFKAAGLLCGLGVVLGGVLGGCAATPKEPTLTPEQKQLAVASFDQVWTTVRDKHYDPKLGGVDWDAAKAELRPKVEAATTATQARNAMNELVGKLKQSHFGVIPAEAYDESRSQSERGDIGVSVRIVDGAALITRVAPGSGAADAGVKPGWALVEIDGKPVTRTMATLAKAYGGKHEELTMGAMAFESRLRGAPGSDARLVFNDGKGRKQRLNVTRKEPAGVAAVFGNLPPMFVEFESRRLEGNIGYIRFNVFLDPPRIMPAFDKAMREFADTRGVIIDLRGNIGGLGPMSVGMGSWFVSESGVKLGTQRTRDSEYRYVLNPRSETYTGKVAVLIDECSISTAEILAGGLKDIGRARVFGVRSAGAALPSQLEILPSGDRLQYVFADYTSAGGKPLEGLGVTPDVLTPPTRAALLAGRDPALDAASSWIEGSAGANAGAVGTSK